MDENTALDKLIPALINIQREVTNVAKSAQGYGYKYAKLDVILDMLRPLCNKHDVLLWQDVSGEDGEKATITTEFVHSSGQTKKRELTVKVPQLAKMNSLQSLGSTISYLRRYCLMSMVGIAATDDEGKDDDGHSGGNYIDENTRQDLITYVAASSLESTAMQEIISKALLHYGVKEINDLNMHQLQAIITRINKG